MELFPAMPLDEWAETKDTMHRFAQIVGKVRLAASPRRNHWWNVPFHLTGRGLTTRPMGGLDGSPQFCVDFDLVRHRLVVDLLDGRSAEFGLVGQSVSSFHAELFTVLTGFGIDVEIQAVPFDLADRTPFADDTRHAAYDPALITRYWRILSQAAQVLDRYAADFCGKTSPVHHFWHTFDLAVTRFTGRVVGASPEADPVTREAYSLGGDQRGVLVRRRRAAVAGVLLLHGSRARRAGRPAAVAGLGGVDAVARVASGGAEVRRRQGERRPGGHGARFPGQRLCGRGEAHRV